MADITINGVTVDPVASAAGVQISSAGTAPEGLAVAAAPLRAADTNYVLVQVDAPLDKARRSQLAAVGAVVLDYVPESTYVCRFEPEDLTPVRALPFVSWAGPYLRGFKLAPKLATAAMGSPASARMSLEAALSGAAPALVSTPETVDVLFHPDVDAAEAAKKVAAAAALDPADVPSTKRKVRLTVAASRLSAIAAIDEVRAVEPVVPVKLHNGVARRILKIDRPNPGSLPFEGAGQIVAVADTGFDRGSQANPHPAFEGRVHKLYALGRPTKSNDPNGHGTHVAGSVLGDGVHAVTNERVRGTAPRARLVLQSLLDAGGGLDGIPTSLDLLFQDPYDDGARVHTNSWGSTLGDGRYDSQSSDVDEFVWNNRDCVVCFAAGNEGVDADGDGVVDRTSVTPPGTAKNCITVGASENDRPGEDLTYGAGWPDSFPVNPLFSDRVADDPEGIVAFSSRGPTRDRRFKPDVVAPGTFILSTRSRDTTSTGWGDTDDPLYMYEGGTSMATPLVAGCCALVREYLTTRKNIPTPSAALVKAMLINGAVDLRGQHTPTEAGAIPNFAEGFGRVDMDATIGGGTTDIVVLEDEGPALDTGDERSWTVQIPAGARALKVTLVWTDPAGPTLQNDLDLIVRLANQEHHGNVATGSPSFDRSNNVEQVLVTQPSAGASTIVVRAFRAAIFPQSFALVARVVS